MTNTTSAAILRRAAALVAALCCGTLAQAQPVPLETLLKNQARHYVPSELLVQFRAGQTPAARDAWLATLGATSIRVLRSAAQRRDGLGELHLLKLPPHLSVPEAARGLADDAAVDFVQPNWQRSTPARQPSVADQRTDRVVPEAGTPRPAVDPYYAAGEQWGLYGNQGPGPTNRFGSKAHDAFAAGRRCDKNTDVIVALHGDGVALYHPDTARNIWVNPGEIAGNGIDDDGNGYIDDINGWNFSRHSNATHRPLGDAYSWGTYYSGVIAAVAHNGIGVAGLCPFAKIITSRFIDSTSWTDADYIASVDYITDLKVLHGQNIVAMHGGYAEYSESTPGWDSQAIFEAYERANAANILLVSSAGRLSGRGPLKRAGRNLDEVTTYPNDNIIVVTSIDEEGGKVRWSNYGLKSVDLGAPSSGYTVAMQDNGVNPSIPAYSYWSGPDMAAAHVAGAVALYASLHPGATAAEIKAAILGSALPTKSMEGKTVTGGRLDVSGF